MKINSKIKFSIALIMKKADSFLKFQKGIILILLTLGTFYTGHTQNYGYEYVYDDAGNRYKRMYIEFIIEKDSNSQESADSVKNAPDIASIIDQFASFEFAIHPNPTSGIIQIDISGDKDVNMNFSLHSLEGSLISKIQQTSSAVTIDLSDQPSGMYILVCQMDGQRKEWKIIKV